MVVDAANKWTRGKLDPAIVRILVANESIPSVLVLNKVSTLSGQTSIEFAILSLLKWLSIAVIVLRLNHRSPVGFEDTRINQTLL